MGDGDDPSPSGSGSLRPVVYQVPLRITSIKTLGAPRWSRRIPSPSVPLPGWQPLLLLSADVAGGRRSGMG